MLYSSAVFILSTIRLPEGLPCTTMLSIIYFIVLGTIKTIIYYYYYYKIIYDDDIIILFIKIICCVCSLIGGVDDITIIMNESSLHRGVVDGSTLLFLYCTS